MKVEAWDQDGKPTYVFDGFAHRAYLEDCDGWVTEQLRPSEVPSVQMARDILSLYNEVNELRRENWQLRRDLKLWRKA